MLQMTKREAQINTNERLEYRFFNIFIWDTGKRRSQTYPNRLKWTKQKSKILKQYYGYEYEYISIFRQT